MKQYVSGTQLQGRNSSHSLGKSQEKTYQCSGTVPIFAQALRSENGTVPFTRSGCSRSCCGRLFPGTCLGHKGDVECVAFSPDGKHIASAGRDGTIRAWHTATGSNVFTLGPAEDGNLGPGSVKCVAFSRDGKRIASGSDYYRGGQLLGEVNVWDANSGQRLTRLRGHSGWVMSVAFSPDGKRVASASDDRTIKLWDTATGFEILTLRGHTARVTSVAFSPDGHRLASASEAGELFVWDATPRHN